MVNVCTPHWMFVSFVRTVSILVSLIKTYCSIKSVFEHIIFSFGIKNNVSKIWLCRLHNVRQLVSYFDMLWLSLSSNDWTYDVLFLPIFGNEEEHDWLSRLGIVKWSSDVNIRFKLIGLLWTLEKYVESRFPGSQCDHQTCQKGY